MIESLCQLNNNVDHLKEFIYLIEIDDCLSWTDLPSDLHFSLMILEIYLLIKRSLRISHNLVGRNQQYYLNTLYILAFLWSCLYLITIWKRFHDHTQTLSIWFYKQHKQHPNVTLKEQSQRLIYSSFSLHYKDK